MATDPQGNLLDELRTMFPWVEQLGLTPEFFHNLTAESASADEVVVKLRAQPQYKARFAGMWRPDGSMRMNEAQYLGREQDFRDVLRQFGYDGTYTTAQSMVGFFDSEMDPNELRDRMSTYRQITESGEQVRDAFYVYAGLDVSIDDLYQAAVDPAAEQRLSDAYNARVAATSFDYQSWITRATDRGLQRVADTLGQLRKSGALTGQAVQTVLRTDPNFARSIMDAIYTNAGQAGGRQLNLSDLLASFEYAAIGAAAKSSGLDMPSKDRLAMIRAAGVDRAKATTSYVQYGTMASKIDDAVRRATGGRFTQADFEDATFLNDGVKQANMRAGLAVEDAAGADVGTFQLQADSRGRFAQKGMRTV